LSGLPHSFDLFCNFGCIGAQPYDTDDLTTLFKNNYLVGKIIGEGAYATVRVAIYKPKQQKIALKIYEKSKIKDAQRKKSVIR
jgi:serine/threonine protein kinase